MSKSRHKKKTAEPPFVSFLVCRERLGTDGLWKPQVDPPVKGGFQINVLGTREGYLQLAEFFRAFAEQNTANDADYHKHFDRLLSADGQVNLNVILRKDDVGNGSWSQWLPKTDAEPPAR